VTKVRRLMWAACVVAVAAWAGVVVATRGPRALEGRFEDRAPKATADVESKPSVRRDVLERPGVPVPSLGPLCEGCLPDDQMEVGDATLRLRLRGDADGLPVEMKVRLWRLDAPENDMWTAGDEVRATLVAPTDGAVVDRLPPGRYRLECLDRRHDTEDPPEFTLSRGVTERDVAVPNRRWFRLRLMLLDEAGSPIARSIRKEGGRSSGGYVKEPGFAPPRWASPRSSRNPDSPNEGFGGYSAGDGLGGEQELVQATPDRFFDLGRHQEDSAWKRLWWSCSFLTESRSEVGVVMWNKNQIGVDTTLVGVAARLDVVVAHVTCPDGSALDPTSAKIESWCESVRFPWTPPADAWRTVPVHVKIVKDGCAPLEFDWTAATADAPHPLLALSTKSSK